MNNLIRKLADQARFVSEPEYPDQDIIFEKFAKLIVRECISICKKKERKNLYGLREAERTIRERFGVDE